MRRVCVFCGSSAGRDPAYAELAREVGKRLARRGVGLVYGGGRVGLMGILADAVMAGGGEVIGVIPERLVAREVAHTGVTELIVVPGMHERKRAMAERADAFLALPGGFGTLEELFEVTTWALLGYHQKPIGLLDPNGYFAGVVSFLDHAVAEGFIRADDRARLQVGADAEAMLDALLEAASGAQAEAVSQGT